MMDDAAKNRLAQTLAGVLNQDARGDYLSRAAALMEVEQLQNPVSNEERHLQFRMICEHLVSGFAGMSDQEIALAEETPKVMRFLIGAMANYVRRVDSVPATSSDRYKLLAEAFGLSEGHGGRRQGRWSLKRRMLAVEAFAKALHDTPPGAYNEKAINLAIEAAYNVVFGSDSKSGREPRQTEKNLKSLIPILITHTSLRAEDINAKQVDLLYLHFNLPRGNHRA